MGFFAFAGVNYHTCPLETREQLGTYLGEYSCSHYPHITEFVIIKTCHRIAFFMYCPDSSSSEEQKKQNTQRFLAHIFKGHTPPIDDLLESQFYFHFDNNAIGYLLQLTSGLNSLVFGEDQIIHQVRQCFLACDAMGFVGKELHQIFSFCFRATKKIRNKINLAQKNMSLGDLVFQLTQKHFADLSQNKILILGAGEIAQLCAKSYSQTKTSGQAQISIASTRLSSAEKLAKQLDKNCQTLPMETALQQIQTFDVVIVAISGNQILLEDRLYQHTPPMKKHLIIDLSVPRKVHPDIGKRRHISLLNIDELESHLNVDFPQRQVMRKEALQIIQEELEDLSRNRVVRENKENVGALYQWITQNLETDLAKTSQWNDSKSEKDRQLFAKAFAKKMVQRASLLAQEGHSLKKDSSVNEVLEILFDISSAKQPKKGRKTMGATVDRAIKKCPLELENGALL